MSELKLPRLLAAAKEFNIGQDTLVEFLASKGFSKDDLKPTAKLTEEMYRALQAEFQSDKVAKMKSIQIDLPKGSVAEQKKKRNRLKKKSLLRLLKKYLSRWLSSLLRFPSRLLNQNR